MNGIIDIHTHILPGIDDGARDWEECRSMLQEAYDQGIRHITATPHYSAKGLPPGLYDLAARLQEEAQSIASDFETGLGQETYFHKGLIEHLKQGIALPLEESRFVLVEFSPQISGASLYQAARSMVTCAYIPVIAHVERYSCLRKGRYMEDLIQCGCMLQMNYSSLEKKGVWDPEARWCRRQVLEGRIHLLATDMHRMDYRNPDLKKSMEWLENHVGALELKALVCRNGEKILQKRNQEIRNTHGEDL